MSAPIDARLEKIRSMSLEELLDVKVEVSANKPTTNRQSPGILTVITRDQILDSGSRDLIDVLFSSFAELTICP